MNVGQLRHRVRLQSPAGSRDAFGERQTTWVDAVVTWASVEPLRGKDAFLAAQQQASTSHKVTVRYDSATSAVTQSWRVMFGTRALIVDNVVNPEEKNISLELYCTEGLTRE